MIRKSICTTPTKQTRIKTPANCFNISYHDSSAQVNISNPNTVIAHTKPGATVGGGQVVWDGVGAGGFHHSGHLHCHCDHHHLFRRAHAARNPRPPHRCNQREHRTPPRSSGGRHTDWYVSAVLIY